MQLIPVVHEFAILHDDVAAAANELMDFHIARHIVELKFEID